MIKHTLVAAVTLFLIKIGPAAAQEATLAQCQQWKDQITKYTNLRRGGGSANQMNQWLKTRHDYEDKFYKAGCRKYGNKIT